MKFTSIDLTQAAIGAVLISTSVYLIPPIQLTFLPVPFTFQILMILWVALLYRPKIVLLSIFTYLALGLIGMPIFSGGRSGWTALFGPTGGFLMGFAVLGWLVSSLHQSRLHGWLKKGLMILAMIGVFYPLATLWLSLWTATPWWISYTSMWVFMVLDTLKLAFVLFVYERFPAIVKIVKHTTSHRYSDN